MKIGIFGITGRMGRLLAEEIVAAGAELSGGTTRTDDPAELAAKSDVVIDFTHAAAVQPHAQALTASKTPWVLGTSGLSQADEATVTQAAREIPIVYAPNFAPGVVLLLSLAEQMARTLSPDFYDAEIVEMHHRQKVDAPSGTAMGLARAVAAGRGADLDQVIESGRQGHTGPRKPGAIGLSALRGGQVVGEHTLLFAGASEHIALTHRAFDRRVFATGAVCAAQWLQARTTGQYSMQDVLALNP